MTTSESIKVSTTESNSPSAILPPASPHEALDHILLHKFHGGIHPPENKISADNIKIHKVCIETHLPQRLHIPLTTPDGSALLSLVKAGDRVLKGQALTEDETGRFPPQHAPTSCEVISIEQIPDQHPSAIAEPMLVLKPDGKDEWQPRRHSTLDDILTADKYDNIQKIFQAGIIGMGGAGFPTATKIKSALSLPAHKKLHTLLINGAECEPYISCDDGLMQNQPQAILHGALIIAKCLNVSKIQIVIEDNKPEAIKALRTARNQLDVAIAIIEIPTRYPSGGEKQLIEIVSGRQVPVAQFPASIGFSVQNVATTVAVFEALVEDKPLISRLVTVTGEKVATPGNYCVPIGMPIEDLLVQAGVDFEQLHQIIMGGPMMGSNINDGRIPVSKTTNCLIVPSVSELPPPPPASPCIRCGLCTEACPASLLPQQLYWHSKSEQWEKAEALNLFDCIECGACSWVCPSHLPLVDYYRYAKDSLKAKKLQQQQTEQARIRHEKKLARLAKQEQEKAARRLQRAEEAKRRKLQREQQDGLTDEIKKQSVADAVARVKARKASRETLAETEHQQHSTNNVQDKNGGV